MFNWVFAKRINIINTFFHHKGKNRVFRGGSWDSRSPDVRAAKRFAATEGRKDAVLGFRCGLSKADLKN